MRLIPRYSGDLGLLDLISSLAKLYSYKNITPDIYDCIARRSGAKFTWTARARYAIQLALINEGISKDDPVVVPMLTCKEVHRAIMGVGGRPVYVEEGERGIPDAESYVKAQRASNARFIVVVNYFGISPDLFLLKEQLEENVVLIYDSALNFSCLDLLSEYKGANYELFSFGNGKPFSIGYGGLLKSFSSEIIISKNRVVADRTLSLAKSILINYASSVIRNSHFLYGSLRFFFKHSKKNSPDDLVLKDERNVISSKVLVSPAMFMPYALALFDRNKGQLSLNEFKGEIFYIVSQLNLLRNCHYYPSNPGLILFPPSISAKKIVTRIGHLGFELSIPYEMEMGDTYSKNWVLLPDFKHLSIVDVINLAKAIRGVIHHF